MIEITGLVITLLLSGFFSSSETAYLLSNRVKLELEFLNKHESHVLTDSQRFLTATLVGNNMVMVACSSLSVIVFASFVHESVLILVTTTFLLVFGEITPKNIAQHIPNTLIRFSGNGIQAFYYLFYPLVKITEFFANKISLMFGGGEGGGGLFSRQAFPHVVNLYTSDDFDKNDELLVRRALKIGKTRVSDIMIPRTEIIGFDIKTEKPEIETLAENCATSRLVVYENSLDQVLGFFYVLDFLEPFKDIRKKIRKPLFLPETTKIVDALTILKKEGKSIAVAVDEHGGTAGLFTIEDIIEDLFGEIHDEYDDVVQRVRKGRENALIVEGRTTIKELDEKYGIKVPDGNYVTISGFIQNELGDIPSSGDVVKKNNIKFIISKASQNTIEQVRIIKRN